MNWGYRKRRDGGYTIARGAGYVAPFVPDSLRYLREFLPTIRKERDSLRLRVNAQSLREFRARAAGRWIDRARSKRQRVLDPAPNRTLNREALAAMIKLYPQFRGAHIVQQWAGYIDCPRRTSYHYISPLGTLPGLTVATGFSGHGFGIGPAAGRLAAELAIGGRSVGGPDAVSRVRFSDGSPILIGPEI